MKKIIDIEKIKKFYKNLDKEVVSALLCGIIGIILFIIIYGFDKISVTNDLWLYKGGDLTQHYIGWLFFREDKWQFPIGNMNSISYPFDTSIIFTDSIPLFAIIFKLLSPMLPKTFQYFGIYGLITFFLQGIFSYILVHKFVDNKKYCIISSIFFILAPTILKRMYAHTALGGQFIITIALCLWAHQDRFRERKAQRTILWTLLLLLATVIHIYFIPMVLIIMVTTFISDFINDKTTLKKSVLTIFIACAISIFTIYLLGGIGNSVKYASGGMGTFISNLNTFINPLNKKSSILLEMPTREGHYEGYGYLGFGIILLLVIIFYEFLKDNKKKEKIKDIYTLSAFAMIIVSFIIATGLNLCWNDKTILRINFPAIIEKIAGIFRATGRFIWIAEYTIIFGALVAFYNYIKKHGERLTIILICMFTLLQIYDLKSYIILNKNQQNIESSDINYSQNLYKEIFSKYDNIVFLPAEESANKIEYIYYFSKIALESNCTINTFYFARTNTNVYSYSDKIIEELNNKQVRNDTIYIFINKNLDKEIREKNKKLYFYEINGTSVAFPKQENQLEKKL